MNAAQSIAHLGSDELIANLRAIVRRSNELTADLLAHLAEVERRGLHLDAGCSSMFVYCTEVLGLSESAAYKRITATRAATRFPVVFETVASGALHLAGLCALLPHLTDANHVELLSAARGMSKRSIEKLLADRFPRPDVPTTLRKLPERRVGSGEPSLADAAAELPCQRDVPSVPTASGPTSAAQSAASAAPPAASTRPIVQPLAPARYRVQLTVDQELYDKIGRARELLSHQIPDRDLAKVLDRALTLLISERMNAKFATRPAGAKGRGRRRSSARSRSRHIPHWIRRAVLARDGEQCTFVGSDGRRCGERHLLEFDHLRPWALGGLHALDNLRLVCRAHNQHRARKVFGIVVRGRSRTGSSPRGELGAVH
jgi:hypothetical protein